MDLQLVSPDEDLTLINAVAGIAFSAAGTARGEAGTAELTRAATQQTPGTILFLRQRLRAGQTVTAVARVDGIPVAVGSHQPVKDVTEIVGVGTLPAFRRRGLAAAVVDLLVEHALQTGNRTVFLSAGSDAVARVYERLGFRRVGTACAAEP